ncbi:MAG: DUF1801 domain-containing protein [Salinibacterium sp.]|nr:DUF1801 domain-containing protein [Salinibacterium sp.]
MPQNLTKPTDVSVDEFISGVEDERRRSEAIVLRELMERVSGRPATMWGPTIVGFGAYSYTTRAGQTEESFVVGFSPRKSALSLYGLWNALSSEEHPLLDSLGPHTTGKGCLYVKKLEAIDLGVLEEMTRIAVERSRAAS